MELYGALPTFGLKSPLLKTKSGQKNYHKSSIKFHKTHEKCLEMGVFEVKVVFMGLFGTLLRWFWPKPTFFLILSKKNKKLKNTLKIKNI